MQTTRHGLLVLADFSGFTEFVTVTELEHGPAMIVALLEEVIRRLAPPLAVEGVAGDAIFALGEDGTVEPPASLLDVLQEAFVGFRTKRRELEADDSCTCNACASVGRLRLKAIGHHGAFVTHVVGGHVQAAGPDVILAHRLLKNGVPRNEDYALFTQKALRHMGIDAGRLGLRPHTEHYDHFGNVACFVGTLDWVGLRPATPRPQGVAADARSIV